MYCIYKTLINYTMKTVYRSFLIILTVFFLSCSKQDILSISDNSLQTKSTTSKAYIQKYRVSEKDVLSFIEKRQTKKTVCSVETLSNSRGAFVYLVNYENGWEILTSDKRMPPVVVSCPKGTYSDSLRLNPAIADYFNWLFDVLDTVQADTTITDNLYTKIWTGQKKDDSVKATTPGTRDGDYVWTRRVASEQTVYYPTYISYGPYLETAWGQRNPWNQKLANPYLSLYHPTGCVAVALSQLFYYYHNTINIPSGLYHDISVSNWVLYNLEPPSYYNTVLTRGNYQEPSSRWATMVKSLDDYDSSDPTSVAGASYVADLMTDVGNRLEMRYYTSGDASGANLLNVMNALPYYGIAANWSYYDYDIAISELQAQRPLYMQGRDDNYNEGHAWVVDGYNQSAYLTTTYYSWTLGYHPGLYPDGNGATQEEANEAAEAAGFEKPEDGMVTMTQNLSILPALFHMNWGWDGSNNGFFIATSISVPRHNQIYNFNWDQMIVYNFRANASSN